jgi:hypothetical protein
MIVDSRGGIIIIIVIHSNSNSNSNHSSNSNSNSNSNSTIIVIYSAGGVMVLGVVDLCYPAPLPGSGTAGRLACRLAVCLDIHLTYKLVQLNVVRFFMNA